MNQKIIDNNLQKSNVLKKDTFFENFNNYKHLYP